MEQLPQPPREPDRHLWWEFERDAQPLVTPEAKAGLKARLMAHVDTIADLRGQVALSPRNRRPAFSAFAYPPRPPRPAFVPQPRGQRPGWRGAPLPPPGLSEEARTQLSAIMAGGGQRQGLLAAVVAGLFPLPAGDHPAMPRRFSRLARHDPKAAALVESLFELAEMLDSRPSSAICDSPGHPAPPADIRYAFLDEGTSTGDACEELAEAVVAAGRTAGA